ncbi:hypothetical protein [Jiella avicenniae]|uniref:Methyltransferase domain-containing protein n=1 Tax=Jiella avicenniae TaxID=2907202 RepID=A0A9X1P2M1_9HYPH|nr:hypothetical protein [Jiella avicenniae]MCE7030247.1 hypothetical protein [Jiella avicenniae]
MTTRPNFDDFLALRRSDPRLARLTHDVALPRSRGVEFGADPHPLPLPDGLSVRYVDLVARDAADEPVRHVWDGSGSLLAALGEEQPLDFAIARLFAHRVPNLLGWFRGVFAALRPGGVLNMTLPDRRMTGDVLRTPSTLGEVLEADQLGLTRPSFRQLFDHRRLSVPLGPQQAWREAVDPGELARAGTEEALAFARAASGDAADAVPCHCWVFTPYSFLDLLEELSRAGLFPLVISQFATTEPGSSEFFVCLRHDHATDPEILLKRQTVAIDHVRKIALERRRRAKLMASL